MQKFARHSSVLPHSADFPSLFCVIAVSVSFVVYALGLPCRYAWVLSLVLHWFAMVLSLVLHWFAILVRRPVIHERVGF